MREVYLSSRFEEIMGMPREQVLGRRRIELFPEEDHAAGDRILDLWQSPSPPPSSRGEELRRKVVGLDYRVGI